jgi:hypothetical protein
MDQQAVSRHTADEISLSLPRFLHISLHGGGQEKKRTSPGQQKTGQGAEHHTPPWVDWEFLATNRFCAPYCVVRRLFRTAQWHPECAIARVRLESLHSRRVRPPNDAEDSASEHLDSAPVDLFALSSCEGRLQEH